MLGSRTSGKIKRRKERNAFTIVVTCYTGLHGEPQIHLVVVSDVSKNRLKIISEEVEQLNLSESWPLSAIYSELIILRS